MMEKIKSKIKNNSSLLIILFYCLFLTFYWFSDKKMVASGEDGMFLYNPKKTLEVYSSTWIDVASGFATSNFTPRLPFIIFVSFLDSKGIETYFIQALIFFLLFLSGSISVYKLTKFLFKNYRQQESIAVVSSFLYLFNPYTMTQLWNRQIYSQYFLFALFPLLLYLYIKGIREKNYKNIVYISIFSFIFSTTFGLITNLLVIWFVIFLFTLIEAIIYKEVFFKIKYLFLTLLVFLSTNLWWLMPFVEVLNIGSSFNQTSISINQNFETLEGLKKYIHPQYVSRLLQGYYFFTGNLKEFYSQGLVTIITFLAFSFCIFSIYILSRDKKNIFLICIFFIGLFFSFGSNYPSRELFLFFFENVTVFQAFRNPYEKFGIVYMLSFVILLSYFLSILRRYKFGNFMVLTFIGFYFYVTYPVFSINYISQSKVEVPSEIDHLNSKMNEISKSNFVVLPFGGEGHRTSWNYNGFDSSLYLFERGTFSYLSNMPILKELTDDMYKTLLYGKDILPFANLNDITHIVVRKDILEGKNFDLNSEFIQNNKPNEIECENFSLDENRISDKNTYVCKLYDFLSIKNATFFVSNIAFDENYEINLVDKNQKRIIFRNHKNYEYDFELADQVEENFNKNEIKEILVILPKSETINIENPKFTFYEGYKKEITGRYSLIWGNNFSEVYRIENVSVKNKDFIEIDRNSFFISLNSNSDSERSVFLNKSYNNGWVLLNVNRPFDIKNPIESLKIYYLAKIEGKKPNLHEKYFNSWDIDSNKSHQVVFIPDVSFYVGIYFSSLCFLVSFLYIRAIEKSKIHKVIEKNKK